MEEIVKVFADHMAWRQQNIPLPILNEKALNTLKTGVIYIHGRTKDLHPICILDIKNLAGLIERKEIDPESFGMLHNFMQNYMAHNMFVPGQVEKCLILVNLNQYPLSSLPIYMFKAVQKEISGNFMDVQTKSIVVNATWF